MSQTFNSADIHTMQQASTRSHLGSDDRLKSLAHRLRGMHTSLAAHIASEEGRCGFFAFLITAAPRYLCMLDYLRIDHEHLMQSVVSLRIKIQRADATQIDALLAETDGLAAAIDDHELLEREMLVDALEGP